MRQKRLALVLIILPLIIIGCGDGDDGGTTDTGVKWVAEVFTGSSSESSTMIGEFTSYDDCIAAVRKESKSAVSNCGIK